MWDEQPVSCQFSCRVIKHIDRDREKPSENRYNSLIKHEHDWGWCSNSVASSASKSLAFVYSLLGLRRLSRSKTIQDAALVAIVISHAMGILALYHCGWEILLTAVPA